MRIGGQRAGEQPVDPRAAELPRRQADAVHHDERPARSPAGRASQCGDSTWRTPRSRPVAASIGQGGAGGGHGICVTLSRPRFCHNRRHDLPPTPPYVARDLAHVWHPCTQMKDHEALPPHPDPPRPGRVARGLRRPALPRRRQLLVGEPVRARQSAHQRRGARAAGAARAGDPRRLHARAGDRAVRGADRASRRPGSRAASTPTTAPPRSKSR